MAQALRCPAGHRWEPTPAQDVWPPDLRSSCPVCGKGPIGPFNQPVGCAVLWVLTGVGGLVLVVVGANLCTEDLLHGSGVTVAGLAFLFLGLIITVGMLHSRRRRKQMAAAAQGLGLSFMAKLTVNSLRAVAPFRLLNPINAPKVFGFASVGTAPLAYNAMLGRFGESDIIFFEYQYGIRERGGLIRTVAAVILPDGAAGLPDFQFAPRLSGFHPADPYRAVDLPDPSYGAVDLAVHGAVVHHYKAWGRDPAAVREALRPELMQYLGRESEWFGESLDGRLLLYRRGDLAPNKHPGFLADVLRVRDLLRRKESATE